MSPAHGAGKREIIPSRKLVASAVGWCRGDERPAGLVTDRLIKKLGGERRGEATFFRRFGVGAGCPIWRPLRGDLREELLQRGSHGFHAVRVPSGDVLFFAEVGREIVEFNLPERLVGRNFPPVVAECERLRAVGSEVVAPEERVRQGERLTGEEGRKLVRSRARSAGAGISASAQAVGGKLRPQIGSAPVVPGRAWPGQRMMPGTWYPASVTWSFMPRSGSAEPGDPRGLTVVCFRLSQEARRGEAAGMARGLRI